MIRPPPRSTRTDTLFPYTTLFRAVAARGARLPRLWRRLPAADHPRAAPGDPLAAAARHRHGGYRLLPGGARHLPDHHPHVARLSLLRDAADLAQIGRAHV